MGDDGSKRYESSLFGEEMDAVGIVDLVRLSRKGGVWCRECEL